MIYKQMTIKYQPKWKINDIKYLVVQYYNKDILIQHKIDGLNVFFDQSLFESFDDARKNAINFFANWFGLNKNNVKVMFDIEVVETENGFIPICEIEDINYIIVHINNNNIEEEYVVDNKFFVKRVNRNSFSLYENDFGRLFFRIFHGSAKEFINLFSL